LYVGVYQTSLDFSRDFATLRLLFAQQTQNMPTNTHMVKQIDHGQRADNVIADYFGITRSQAAKLIKAGRVQLEGNIVAKTGTVVKEGEVLTLIDDMAKDDNPDKSIYENIQIIGETNEYLVIHKPAGLLVHPTMKGEPVTLADWVVTHDPHIQGVGENSVRPGIVHRLDKDASGLLVIAKTQDAYVHLKEQFKNRTVKKYYTVLVHGIIENKEHEHITFTIDRGTQGKMVSRPHTDKLDLKKVTQVQPGKEADTEFWVEKTFVNYTLLRVQIHTGRTHQIRVHMLAYGHPVVGDTLYKNKKLITNRDRKLGRIFLHATDLSFLDLAGNEQIFHATLPKTLQTFLSTLT